MPAGPIRRVAIMGPPGSGKSTLARELGGRLGLPVTHLDRLHHAPGWVPRPAAEFRPEMEAVAAGPEWVIEGNYFAASTARLERAELIILLDLPRRVTFPRLIRRMVTGLGRVRPDSAPGCPERIDLRFLHYCWHWRATKRQTWLDLVAPWRDKTVHIASAAYVERVAAALRQPQLAPRPQPSS